MDLKTSNRFKITGRTIESLARSLDYRSSNQRVIAGNLANIDTPGYQPKELRFDQELERALGKQTLQLKTTDPRHINIESTLESKGYRLVKRQTGPVDSDPSNLDHEMAQMMKNNLLYEASARLMAKKIQALKYVISQGRR
jgi:flagellar basal-body rod protein FlgB